MIVRLMAPRYLFLTTAAHFWHFDPIAAFFAVSSTGPNNSFTSDTFRPAFGFGFFSPALLRLNSLSFRAGMLAGCARVEATPGDDGEA